MAQRKFNIFQRTTGTEFQEKILDRKRKYRMKRDGTLVEYDEDILNSQKSLEISSLDSQLSAGQITQSQYDTQVATIEKEFNTLEKLASESLDDELIFSGSKSDIRKGEMAERNISVLQNTKVDVNNLRYDIAFYSPNEQPLSETIMAFLSPVALRVSTNFSQEHGSDVKWEGFVVEPYEITVKLNSNELGVIRINPDNSWETTVTTAFNIAKGDVLSYVSPENFEADFKNLSITLAANQINK